ncbi:MAG: primosomal protein N' [Sandaracinus sp.]
MRFVDVALPVPLRRLFTYRLPEPTLLEARGAWSEDVRVGHRVAVPFHGRTLAGIVVETHARPPAFETREVLGVIEAEPVIDRELGEFLRAAADYYLHPLGEVMRTATPPLAAEAVRALSRRGAIARVEDLRGARAARRTQTFVRRAALAAPARLGPRQREVIAVVEARVEIGLAELEALIPGGRAHARALAKRGLFVLEEREVELDPFFASPVEREVPRVPTAEQRTAIDAITAALRAQRGGTFLLHGITGSGKTEVYLQAIAEVRAAEQGAIVLVPEIALTPQLVTRFRARFGDGIAVLHSELSDRDRREAWERLRRGEVSLAIGPRSALFAPVRALGIVVVDEEHDGSYKQEEGFRYHARDMAILRAQRAGAVAILGSATPSLESYQHARRGTHTLLTLTERATPRSLPRVEIVDLTRTGAGPSGDPLLTLPLHRALVETLEAGDQAVLFLNRRGYAPSLRCARCGSVASCPACSVALTEHRKARVMRCHYCDFAAPVGTACGACGAPELVEIGLGTEKVEDHLERVLPSARIARLDRDVASGAGIEAVLERVKRHEVDVLVGTQMVTKGHDLPGVTLVGVLLADQSLAFPDFRSAERTFQLLTQVAGRAGRGEREGRVIFQTYQPSEPAVACAVHHDYLAFAEDELAKRKELGYAPFGRLVAVRVDAPEEGLAESVAERLASIAREQVACVSGEVEVLGPAPAPIARVRGRFRQRVLLKGRDRRPLRAVALAVLTAIDEGLAPARASLDVDPVNML